MGRVEKTPFRLGRRNLAPALWFALFGLVAGCAYPATARLPVQASGWTRISGSCGSAGQGSFCWQWDAAGEVLPPSRVSLDLDLREIGGSLWQGCGLTPDGSAYCWGPAFSAIRAAPPSESCGSPPGRPCSIVPKLVSPSTRFTRLTVGGQYACGLTAEGTAVCWGQALSSRSAAVACPPGSNGACGEFQTFPGRFVAISAGGGHACAIEASGETFCWGNGGYGALGADAPEVCPYEGTTIRCSTLAIRVQGNHRFVQVTAGGTHTCGIDRTGTAYCWGSNSSGQLGTSSQLETCLFGHIGVPCTSRPVEVEGGLRFRQISAGENHTCGVVSDGSAFCWGEGGRGQLGQGIIERVHPYGERRSPVRVLGNLQFSSVDANGPCGLTTDQRLYCWGMRSPSRDIAAPFPMPDPPATVALESFRLTELPERPSVRATVTYAAGSIEIQGVAAQHCANNTLDPAVSRDGDEVRLWLIARRWEGGGCEESDRLVGYTARLGGLAPGRYTLTLIYHYADDADRRRPEGLGPIEVTVPG